MKRLCLCLLLLCPAALADNPQPSPALKTQVVAAYAEIACAVYGSAAGAADRLTEKIDAFLKSPDEPKLAACREAWSEAHRIYGLTEPCRYYSGPIDDDDGPEPMINSWPVDEQFIEGKDGLISNTSAFPNITPKLLEQLNQQEGETHVAAGFHAIEFLLWGVDSSVTGPGNRPATDFAQGDMAGRRADCLLACATLLSRDLRYVADDWLPGKLGNYRAIFVENAGLSLPRILVGMSLLAGAEMAGERLAVALETGSQEEEQSCFSDTTHRDFLANAQGLQAFWTGKIVLSEDVRISGKGVRDLTVAVDTKLAEKIDSALALVLERAAQLPVPFDQMLALDAASAPRQAAERLLVSLEDLADLLRELGAAMELDIPSDIPLDVER